TATSDQAAPNSSGFIDLVGPIFMSGFNTVKLYADRDIRTSDVTFNIGSSFYPLGNSYQNSSTGSYTIPLGMLWTAGDLVLQADRIYPDMMASESPDPSSATATYTFSPSTFTFQAGVFDGNDLSKNNWGTVYIKSSTD